MHKTVAIANWHSKLLVGMAHSDEYAKHVLALIQMHYLVKLAV